tara:strand:- start:23705 stop:23893 length:189 start_codon:yes stop_codon:yes gene_type:complete
MPEIQIDGKSYDTDNFSDEAKSQVASLRFVQSEIQRLEANIAVCKTAQNTYVSALKSLLEED